jgi:TolA-binding protein
MSSPMNFGTPTLLAALAIALLWSSAIVVAQEPAAEASDDSATSPARGSLVEDRAARKLLEAGDARLDAEETDKAVEIWKSVIERYPRSKLRYEAHLRLGNFYLDRERAYDRARPYFESVAAEDNRDEAQRAEATLKLGICFYHARNYGKCFQIMRDVIEDYPVSPQVNEAYYYIGLGHFQLGHYSRAIAALEKVGTTLSAESEQGEKLEAGKRLFLKIEDADLAVLEPDQAVKVICKTTSGDEEMAECFPVGRNVRLVLGSIGSRLGAPIPGNGVLEVRGGDKVNVTYVDEHTADKKLQVPVLKDVLVVGTASVAVTDGAFAETVNGVVLGKSLNVRLTDADRDTTPGADAVKVLVEVFRRKTDAEIEAELVKLAQTGAASPTPAANQPLDELPEDSLESQVSKLKLIDSLETTLTEVIPMQVVSERPQVATASPDTAAPATPTTEGQSANSAIHTGLFHGSIAIVKAETPIAGNDTLEAGPQDIVRVTYLDESHSLDGVRQVQAEATCLEGSIGGVRVTKTEISDLELKIQTQLKTADALTQIGNRYKEFGLKDKAVEKYDQALTMCDEIAIDARKLGGSLLELTYVQLWNIYFAMDKLDLAAAMCQRLQNEFPESGFVDDALLQLAEVARTQGDLQRAIGVFSRLVAMETSQLRGEAQFGVAQCYDDMSLKAEPAAASQLQDRAFQEYKRVYDEFPESGRVGEAVAKMANYYYIQKDYARAIDTFETVLASQPDAKFLDVILFNYGRCLYRMERKSEARQRFDQLISEFPESPLAADAKKISDALVKTGF